MPQPLESYTVVDLTRILSGPYATMALADLGARVIKIERADAGDDTRAWGPPFHNGMSTYFAAVNRGKESVAVDLSAAEGREIVLSLVAKADVLVENFKPGVTERLGLDYAAVRAVRPDIVYASINGFGSTGPKAQTPGTEVIIEAETGLMDMMGSPGGPPVRFGVAMIDIATGLAAVAGVVAALLRRSRDGNGAYLEFPLYATALSSLATVIAASSVEPESQDGRWGSGHPSIVPYSAYEASDGFVVIGAINDEMFARLCTALALPELLEDDRCRKNETRVVHRAFVERAIGEAVETRPVSEVTACLERAGVLVAPVRSTRTAVADPHTEALELIDHAEGLMLARSPLSQFNAASLPSAPALGQHTRSLLRDELGYDEQQVSDLEAAGIVSASS